LVVQLPPNSTALRESEILTKGRGTEEDIKNLFNWASCGHQRITNQRVRPSLVMIINKFVLQDSDYLNVDYATEKLLSQFQLSGSFSEQVDEWQKRGKTLKTASDLILCYYSSIRVVCIPAHPGGHGSEARKAARYIAQQYRVLDQEIRLAYKRQRDTKLSLDMNLTVETFNNFVDHAFDRLSRNLNTSIDFYYLSTQHRSAPSSFNSHLTNLIYRLLQANNYDKSNEVGFEEVLLQNLLPYLSWCISTQVRSCTDPAGKFHERTVTKC
jgi:hypothetical protein